MKFVVLGILFLSDLAFASGTFCGPLVHTQNGGFGFYYRWLPQTIVPLNDTVDHALSQIKANTYTCVRGSSTSNRDERVVHALELLSTR